MKKEKGLKFLGKYAKITPNISKDEKEEMISVSLQLQKNLFASSQQQATSGPLGQ